MLNVPTMQELLEAGVHFGHQIRRGNPKMNQYIFGVREGVHIVDLEHSERLLKAAAEEAYRLGKEGKVLMFVGTKKQAQPIIKELSDKAGLPCVDFRWMGGTLTNFDEIRKNVKKLVDLKDKKSKGELTRYTKKEQLLISRKLEKFAREYQGMEKLEKTPDALFIVDCVTEKNALLEANRVGIEIIAVVDSNANPSMVNFPIPGNDDAVKSIKILVETIANAYIKGKEDGKTVEVTPEQAAVEEKKADAKKAKAKKEDKEPEAIVEEVAAIEEVVEAKTAKESSKEV